MIWRLVRQGALPADWNMAVDLALLEREERRPILRLYGWRPAALSLSHRQDADRVVDFASCRRLGIDVVRRPTGGYAVLHDGAAELTYAVVADEALMPGGVLETYRRIADALICAMGALGIRAELAPHLQRGAAPSAVCFETPTDLEIVVGGRKAVGSAQCRRGGRILQHGAIALSLDRDRQVAPYAFSSEAERERRREGLLAHAISLSEAAGRPIGFAEAADAVLTGFARAAGARFAPEDLTAAEVARARALRDGPCALLAAPRAELAAAGG